ncbi:conserved oligomeric Golgi complex subunit 3, partial [Phenoliferia sp. Uapishka_3]
MSSSRATSSRVSLEEWDSLAQLSPAEIISIDRVQQRADERPLPTRLQQSQQLSLLNSNSRPSTPRASHINLNSLLASPSGSPRPSSAAGGYRLPQGDLLDISVPIETTQQFHDWFARVEQSIEREQEEIYRTHLAELDDYIDNCDQVLEQLDDSRGLLSEMEANYRFVEDNSRALQLACENMLDEQKHLIEVTEAIGARLEYFRELETATKMLNLPGEALVLQDDFLNMVDRLDISLDYLKANRDFKDSEIYLIRFQQCLTRSMTLIKMYFISVIRRISSEVSERMVGKELTDAAANALLYTKFSNSAPTLRTLIFELEKRARAERQEYGSLLDECYNTWFACRSGLLAASLAEEVRRMDPGSTDLIKLVRCWPCLTLQAYKADAPFRLQARSGCNHLRSVCVNEWSLCAEVFSSGETEIYQFLENLCDYLYDSLRPRILHEPKLEVLCELCTVLTAMMALDSTATANDDSDDEDNEGASSEAGDAFSSHTPTHAIKSTLGRIRFSVLLQTILQDSQTRLVFRAQAVIQSEVLYYVPLGDDLDYPKRIEGHEKEGLSLWTEDERLRDGEVGGFRLPREEVQVTWYPTLKRTVWVLSKLNTYVNSAIFEDFAGEAVTLCRQSLSAAAGQVSMRPDNSKIDGQLFLIRHLLLLKEMIRSVDLVQIERAADFSSVTDALVSLLKNTSVIFNPNALFELASRGIPSFTETMTDAKMDLDGSLKRACEELISETSARLASPIRTFLDRCTAYLSSPNGKDLPAQTWADPEAVLKLHEDFQKTLIEQAKEVVAKLRVYLNDEKTIGVLLPPLLVSLFFSLVTRSEYGFATSSSLLTPLTVKERLQEASSVAFSHLHAWRLHEAASFSCISSPPHVRQAHTKVDTTTSLFLQHTFPPVMTSLQLNGQIALVTGAGSLNGIGRAIVLECVRQGALAVYAADLHIKNAATLLQAAKEIRSDAIVESCVLDAGAGDDIKAKLIAILTHHGRFDLFFANAGFDGYRALSQQTEQDMIAAFRVFQLGPFWALKHGASAMAVKSKNKDTTKGRSHLNLRNRRATLTLDSALIGSIIITASLASFSGGCTELAYTSSKHAQIGIIRSRASLLRNTHIRWKAQGIDVNTSDPTVAMCDLLDMFNGKTDMTSITHPEEVARVAVFLSTGFTSHFHNPSPQQLLHLSYKKDYVEIYNTTCVGRLSALCTAAQVAHPGSPDVHELRPSELRRWTPAIGNCLVKISRASSVIVHLSILRRDRLIYTQILSILKWRIARTLRAVSLHRQSPHLFLQPAPPSSSYQLQLPSTEKMNTILARANTVFKHNPVVADIDITTSGSDFLWAIFACLALSAITLLVLGSRQPVGQRAFHQLAAVICSTASIAYFCMASDLGATPIVVEYIRAGNLGANQVAAGILHPTRSIWYARYIDWVITTPLLLLELLLTTGLPLSEIFTTLFFDEAMIVTGLVGALVSSEYKWGLFTFGMLAEFYVGWVLFVPARASAARLGSDFYQAYWHSALLLCGLWLLYPVAWGISEGANLISPDGEMYFYGVLDLISKPVFCFYHVYAMSKCDYSRLQMVRLPSAGALISTFPNQIAFLFFQSSGKVSDGATDSLIKGNGLRATPSPVPTA